VTSKTERLVNLIALLLETRRPLTQEEIRARIPGYADSDVAFRRMFERDKEELRDLGIPLERVATDAWDAQDGYLISPERATLPDLDLSADERAALWLASQAWQGQAVPGDPDRALMKLSLASRSSGAADPTGDARSLQARVDASSPLLGPLFDAVAARKRVTFRYRRGGGDAPRERTVDPYGLRYRGAWYLAGYDHTRNELRHFKLDRIEGRVEVGSGKDPDFDAPRAVTTEIPRGPWAEESDVEATVAFAPDAAWWVERRTGARRTRTRPDGWVELTFGVGDSNLFASWILGFADDAVVLAPEHLQSDVLARLRSAAGEG
jgi:proteasome accessory factor B